MSIQHPLVIGLLLSIAAIPFTAQARTQLTKQLQIEESFIDNETATDSESGLMTSISPSVSFQRQGARSALSVDYGLNAVIYNGLSADNKVDQSMALRSDITHVTNQWNSYLKGGIRQTSISPDGVQLVNSNLQSDNTREMLTLGAGTDAQGRWSDAITYQSGLSLDYADAGGSSASNSLGLNLHLTGKPAGKINWSTSLSTRQSRTTGADSSIHTLGGNVDYRFNLKYAVFLAIDQSSSGNNALDSSNAQIGLNWTPSRNSSVRIGLGKRGSDSSYSLDSMLSRQQWLFTLNYSELVTTSRALLLDVSVDDEGVLQATQTLSVTPVLVKNGRIGMTLQGRRSDITLSYFNQSKNLQAPDSNDEVSDGVSLTAKRTLSQRSSVQLSWSNKKVETLQKNRVSDLSLSYDRQWSKQINASLALRSTKQTSNVAVNEYDQRLITLSIKASF